MSINYSKKTASLVGVAANGSPNDLAQDALTYEPFFGLNEKPFSLDTDPRFLYASPTHDATRKALLASIRRREGLLVLTGEIGTGKTTLCRTVLRELGRNTYSSLVPDPFAAREDLLKMLLIDFGVLSIHDITEGHLRQASRTELGYLLSDFLDKLSRDAYAVVMIDEAQNLSLPLIEETRVLFDSFGARGRLQILFVGQPELHAKLKLPEMRQVDQRICGYHRLGAMNAEAVAGYIEHRLYVAGGDPDRVLFPPAMVEALYKRTGGVPRLINRVCDRALQLAYEHRDDVVNPEVFDAALIEVGAVTLSPTWDSIIFADGPAKLPVAAAAAPVPSPAPAASLSSPAPLPAPVLLSIPDRGMDFFQKETEVTQAHEEVKTEAAADTVKEAAKDGVNEKGFNKDVDEWVQQDLATPVRPRSPLFEGLDELIDEKTPIASVAPRAPAPTLSRQKRVRIDWPRDVRSETYVQKAMRTWAKRTVIALAAFIALNIVLAGTMSVLDNLEPPTLPALPGSPAKVLPGLELPAALDEPAVSVVFVGDDASSVEIEIASSETQ